jgi:hypothetical protein
MNKEKKKDGPYLFIMEQVEYGNRKWLIRPVYRQGDDIHFYPSWGDEKEFDDFEVRAYFWEAKDMANNNNRAEVVFGWKYGYSKSFVDSWAAKDLVKWLNRIDARMVKQDEQYGRPTAFSDFVVRIGNALKAKGFVRKSPNPHFKDEYQWMNYGEGKFAIDRRHFEYVKECCPAETSAA